VSGGLCRVHIPGFSVVVRNSTIEERFPGGSAAFARKCPNKTLCSDGILTKVSFMANDDAEFFLKRLIVEGLVTPSDDVASETALTSQNEGVRPPSNWLAVGRVGGRTVAWIAGSVCGQVALPYPDAQDMDMIDAPKSYARVRATASIKPKASSNRRESSGDSVYVGEQTVVNC
jgi:hypothetical protein